MATWVKVSHGDSEEEETDDQLSEIGVIDASQDLEPKVSKVSIADFDMPAEISAERKVAKPMNSEAASDSRIPAAAEEMTIRVEDFPHSLTEAEDLKVKLTKAVADLKLVYNKTSDEDEDAFTAISEKLDRQKDILSALKSHIRPLRLQESVAGEDSVILEPSMIASHITVSGARKEGPSEFHIALKAARKSKAALEDKFEKIEDDLQDTPLSDYERAAELEALMEKLRPEINAQRSKCKALAKLKRQSDAQKKEMQSLQPNLSATKAKLRKIRSAIEELEDEGRDVGELMEKLKPVETERKRLTSRMRELRLDHKVLSEDLALVLKSADGRVSLHSDKPSAPATRHPPSRSTESAAKSERKPPKERTLPKSGKSAPEYGKKPKPESSSATDAVALERSQEMALQQGLEMMRALLKAAAKIPDEQIGKAQSSFREKLSHFQFRADQSLGNQLKKLHQLRSDRKAKMATIEKQVKIRDLIFENLAPTAKPDKIDLEPLKKRAADLDKEYLTLANGAMF